MLAGNLFQLCGAAYAKELSPKVDIGIGTFNAVGSLADRKLEHTIFREIRSPR